MHTKSQQRLGNGFGLRVAAADEGRHSRLARLKARRKLWLKVHLYLGLFAGAVLAVIGLTGSVLVFWPEIDAWLNPALLTVQAPMEGEAAYRPLDEIVAAAQATMPTGVKPGFTYYPRDPEDVFQFFYEEPGVAEDVASTFNVFVDPYTARVTGTRVFYDGRNPFGHCLMGFFFKLHYALLLKDTGVTLVGAIGVLLVVSVLTGLIVWWPLTGQWFKALTFKRRASPERFVFDLHKTSGFYSSLVLLAVLVSGVYMNLPEQVLWLVERFSPVNRPEAIKSKPLPASVPLDLAKVMAIAEERYPGGKPRFLNLPAQADGVYRICRRGVEELSSYVLDTRCVAIDQYSGQILQVSDAATGSGGDLFVQWQWPLHSGQAFGMTGRILVFLSGLACPLLFVTGVLRWLHKRRAKRLWVVE